MKSKENISHRARKIGGESLDKSGKQTDKVNRRKAEEKIKGELEGFIRKLMNAKLIDDKTKTSTDKNAIPELDVKLDENQLKEICLRAREQFMLEPVFAHTFLYTICLMSIFIGIIKIATTNLCSWRFTWTIFGFTSLFFYIVAFLKLINF